MPASTIPEPQKPAARPASYLTTPYGPEELQTLTANAHVGFAWLRRLLPQRSANSIVSKCEALGLAIGGMLSGPPTPEEEALIREHFPSHGVEPLMERLPHRTRNWLYARGRKLCGRPMPRSPQAYDNHWTEAEDQVIRENAQTLSAADIATMLQNRSAHSVRARASHLQVPLRKRIVAPGSTLEAELRQIYITGGRRALRAARPDWTSTQIGDLIEKRGWIKLRRQSRMPPEDKIDVYRTAYGAGGIASVMALDPSLAKGDVRRIAKALGFRRGDGPADPEREREVQRSLVPQALKRPVQHLGLPKAQHGALRAAGFHYIGDVVTATDVELMAVPRFGLSSLRRVHDALEALGHRTGEPCRGWPSRH